MLQFRWASLRVRLWRRSRRSGIRIVRVPPFHHVLFRRRSTEAAAAACGFFIAITRATDRPAERSCNELDWSESGTPFRFGLHNPPKTVESIFALMRTQNATPTSRRRREFDGCQVGGRAQAGRSPACSQRRNLPAFLRYSILCPLLMRRINPNCGRVDLFRRFIPLPTNNSSWVDQRQIGSYSVPPSLFSAKVHSGFSGGRELCAQFSAALPSHGRPLCKIRLRVWNT